MARSPRFRFPRSTSRRSAIVITVSDRSARGQREDLSGPRVVEYLERHEFEIIASAIIPDRQSTIMAALRSAARAAALVVTTGGTGFSPRDVTPEATRRVLDRLAPGLSEAMRAGGAERHPQAWLSRGVAGIKGHSIIVNLPGSPGAAEESLAAIVDVLPHGLDVLTGADVHASSAFEPED